MGKPTAIEAIGRIVHVDWSKDPEKRWACWADRKGGNWLADGPEKFGTVERRFFNTRDQECTLCGFDFPIGVPAFWGSRTGEKDFKSLLPLLGKEPWDRFFDVAVSPSEISLHRPFYPMRSSRGLMQASLTLALEADGIDTLRRVCEPKTADRPAACSLFWTLGGNQVGKGALTGWKEIVIPEIQAGAAIWPFDGTLTELARRGGRILAETFPAEAYRHVGVAFGPNQSKRRRDDRMKMADHILVWANDNKLQLSKSLRIEVSDGFGSRSIGEDKFDAFVGLAGMLQVVEGRRVEGPTDDQALRIWEGWILGQSGVASSREQKGGRHLI